MAAAHPVDEVVQGAYLTLAAGVVQLELGITPGSQVADKVMRPLDSNHDQQLSQAEARAYALRVLAQSSLSLNGLNGQNAAWNLQKVEVPPYSDLATGNALLKIYAVAARPERVGASTLTYVNRYQPAKSRWMANIFLQPAGWQYTVTAQSHSNDGRRLTVTYTAANSPAAPP